MATWEKENQTKVVAEANKKGHTIGKFGKNMAGDRFATCSDCGEEVWAAVSQASMFVRGGDAIRITCNDAQALKAKISGKIAR